MTPELRAFRAADFNWTRALQSVWTEPDFQVDELHRGTLEILLDDFQLYTKNKTDNPIGRVVLGPAGAGKTHLIGTLRRRVWEMGGWFVLLDIVGVSDFWATAAHCFVQSLLQPMANGRTQYRAVLSEIAKKLPLDSITKNMVAAWEAKPNRTRLDTVDLFLRLLQRVDATGTTTHQDVVRAFLLLDSTDMDVGNLAYCWLQGIEIEDARRRELKFLRASPGSAELVRGMIWIMSLAGPVMIAVDQIDAIVGASNALKNAGDDVAEEGKARHMIELLAGGLMDLHDLKRRAMTVVSCLQVTWPIIKQRAVKSAAERFEELPPLKSVTDRAIVENLIGRRLDRAYSDGGFHPPYRTWPFRPDAIDSAIGLLPREILMRCQKHRQRCIELGQMDDCLSLAEVGVQPREAPASRDLDQMFKELLASADIAGLLDEANEDTAARGLIVHACEMYLGHLDLPNNIDGEVKTDPNPEKPSLHASLAFVFHEDGDREQHYSFRFLAHSHPRAFQSRLKAAMTASGIDAALKFRHLIVLRRGDRPSGKVSDALMQAFEAAGGRTVAPTDADLRALVALRAMADADPANFEAWLRARKPLFETTLFKAAGLAPPAFLEPAALVEALKPMPLAPAPKQTPARAVIVPADAIPIGRRIERGALGASVALARGGLSSHTAILAGTGSGKTVLLRRIIEEAALIGIPAIVLDANNDLSRLGEPWPTRPESFTDEDAAHAAAYHARSDVAVWTPGASAGRPLYLSLLPDFAGLVGRAGDQFEDDLTQAIEMAQSTLEPYVGGSSQKSALKRGVLAGALRVFARGGGGSVEDLIYLLTEPPDNLSEISDAPKLAREVADQLRAAIATNPLLKTGGPILDPAQLFTGKRGRTRVSVINLAGLASDAAKQAFVNQLQMALFTWIKQNPSPTGRLYAIDEAQNFAPSQIGVVSKRSTLALASQARKYGLGMIFATQHPKGIENAIVSNCATQFYGRMNSPSPREAIEEMIASKGGASDDVARLTAGEFYFSTEGAPRPVKIRAPLCLSWHPPNPPTPAEVVNKARIYREAAPRV